MKNAQVIFPQVLKGAKRRAFVSIRRGEDSRLYFANSIVAVVGGSGFGESGLK